MINRNAQFIWAFLFSALIVGSIFQSHAKVWLSVLNMSLVLIGYVTISTGETVQKRKWWLVIFIALFIYSISFSPFTRRSAYFALSYIFAFLFFCTLSDLMRQRSSLLLKNISAPDYTKISKRIVLLLGVIHAASLIVQYSLNPIRSTGILLDYSQASLLILIAFGLNYRWLKAKGILGVLLCALLFLGFFTTFSRTSNFLLVVFLALIFIAELRAKQLPFILTLLVIVSSTYLIILFYPELLNAPTVNRGGLEHFRTLNSRTYYWASALEAIRASPLLGNGLGNYEYLGIKEVLPYSMINSAHNDYLQIWVDLGLFWFLLLVFSVAYTVLMKAPVMLRPWQIGALDESYIAWALFLCIGLYMLINFAIHSFIFQILFCVILAELFQEKKSETQLQTTEL